VVLHRPRPRVLLVGEGRERSANRTRRVVFFFLAGTHGESETIEHGEVQKNRWISRLSATPKLRMSPSILTWNWSVSGLNLAWNFICRSNCKSIGNKIVLTLLDTRSC